VPVLKRGADTVRVTDHDKSLAIVSPSARPRPSMIPPPYGAGMRYDDPSR